jgi:hypothetical protein
MEPTTAPATTPTTIKADQSVTTNVTVLVNALKSADKWSSARDIVKAFSGLYEVQLS